MEREVARDKSESDQEASPSGDAASNSSKAPTREDELAKLRQQFDFSWEKPCTVPSYGKGYGKGFSETRGKGISGSPVSFDYDGLSWRC